MTSRPLVSVIVPAYQMGDYLAHTLESVTAQDHVHWECIVVDDGSTDGTWSRVAHIIGADRRFRFVRQANAGISAARNTGLRLVSESAEYVAFLDADDTWAPGTLATFVAALEASPAAVGIYGYADHIDERGSVIDEGLHPSRQQDRRMIDGLRLRSVERQEPITFSEMVVVSPIYPAGTALHRRKIVDRVGTFDTSLVQLEDWDYYLRMSRHGDYLTHPVVVAYYRKHAGQITSDVAQSQSFNSVVRSKAVHDETNTPGQRRDSRNASRQIMARKLVRNVLGKVRDRRPRV